MIVLLFAWASVTEAAIDELITGVGTPETVLQIRETETRTASTAEPGTITWASDNAAVATVDAATGIVTAVAGGTANISYLSDSGNTSTIAVTVYAAATVIDPTLPPETAVQV